jgi:hypothetical protein
MLQASLRLTISQLSDKIQDFYTNKFGTSATAAVLTHCKCELMQAIWSYSGSKNRPDVWMFFTKVNNPTHLLIWALICECMKESPYHRLSMGPRVKRTG